MENIPAHRRLGEQLELHTHLLDTLEDAVVALDQVRLEGRDALPSSPLGKRGRKVLHIVGEAITNSRRHSGARTITVDARGSDARAVRIKVEDDGGWRDRSARARPGHRTGITGMTERAALLGGILNIDSPRSGGTVVSLELPVGLERQ